VEACGQQTHPDERIQISYCIQHIFEEDPLTDLIARK